MSKHQKRHAVPTTWPIARKGTKFVVSKTGNGIPVLVALRDMLKLAQNRREVKAAIHKGDLIISGKAVNDEKKTIELFDVLTIVPAKKNYRLELTEFGKYGFTEVTDKDAKTKVSKVVGKKSISAKKTQINLYDGRNYLSDTKCSVNDSVIVDLTKNTISKVLPMKEKAEVLAIGGKYIGHKGKIAKLIPEDKMAEVKTEKGSFKALIKQLVVIA